MLPAMQALDRGGIVAVAGIYLSPIPSLDYEKHLFYEKELRSVTANTRADGDEFLKLAARSRFASPFPSASPKRTSRSRC